MNFKIVKSKSLFKGKVFDLLVDEIEYSSGNKAVREIALHPGGAVVVPVTADNKIIMVTQYRYPLKKVLSLDSEYSAKKCRLEKKGF